jgi:phosphotransferase system HPr (HPr) family protein
MVLNPQGLHARPAHAVVTLATRFQSEIEMIRDGEIADAKSILAILTLAAEQGTEITIRATGDDAGEALDALTELFDRGFGEAVEQAETESEAGGPS